MNRETDLAYLAGLIDGEGTITIGRRYRRLASGEIRKAFQPKFLLVNTDVRLIDRCREILGFGTIYMSKADRTGAIPDNWNPVHRYQAVSEQARTACELLRPFLIAKAAHADVILSMPRRSRDSNDLSAVSGQTSAYEIITDLNRRGRKSAASIERHASTIQNFS